MLDAIVALSLISNPPWKTLNGPRRRQTNTNTLTETETSMNKQTGERERTKKSQIKAGPWQQNPSPGIKIKVPIDGRPLEKQMNQRQILASFAFIELPRLFGNL